MVLPIKNTQTNLWRKILRMNSPASDDAQIVFIQQTHSSPDGQPCAFELVLIRIDSIIHSQNEVSLLEASPEENSFVQLAVNKCRLVQVCFRKSTPRSEEFRKDVFAIFLRVNEE